MWSLELFTHALQDYERAQYQILGEIQNARRAFAQNRIYPHLADLVRCYATLQTIVKQSDSLRDAWPGQISRIDLDAQEIVFTQPELDNDQLRVVHDLIHWALPHIQAAIEEGRTIFEFVEDHLRLAEVGIVPSYVQEGYLFVPDHDRKEVHVLLYSFSIFTGANERYRSLKTTLVKSVPQQPFGFSPRSLKLDLMAERKELPNPATYYLDSELDFPFESTLLPVAKRMLMRYLNNQPGLA